MNAVYNKISLLECAYIFLGCENFMGLRVPDRKKYAAMADALENNVSMERTTLLEWNELIHIIAGEAPEETKEAAKAHILRYLRDNSRA